MCKKTISLLLAGVTCFWMLAFPGFIQADAEGEAAAGEPQVSARAAVLINADNGQVLFGKNEEEQHSMASTTKIMTALIALEKASTDDKVVTITDQMVRVEGSSMGLMPGDKLTLKSLAAGMLIVSGNDAANSAAIAVAGSAEDFAVLMNQRAQELGMEHTHFVTPSGLDDEQHYSTAHDMAKLAMAAMKNPDFANIVGQKAMNIDYIHPDQTRRYTNHNKLLSMYEDCTGVKTGFTKKSGRCLVSAAERDGVRLIAVTLNAPDDWNDHQAMLNYGFLQLEPMAVDDSAYRVSVPVVGGTASTLSVMGEAGEPVVVPRGKAAQVERVVELPRFLYAPVTAGQIVGRVTYRLDGTTLAQTDLVAGEGVDCPVVEKTLFQKIADVIKHLFL